MYRGMNDPSTVDTFRSIPYHSLIPYQAPVSQRASNYPDDVLSFIYYMMYKYISQQDLDPIFINHVFWWFGLGLSCVSFDPTAHDRVVYFWMCYIISMLCVVCVPLLFQRLCMMLLFPQRCTWWHPSPAPPGQQEADNSGVSVIQLTPLVKVGTHGTASASGQAL